MGLIDSIKRKSNQKKDEKAKQRILEQKIAYNQKKKAERQQNAKASAKIPELMKQGLTREEAEFMAGKIAVKEAKIARGEARIAKARQVVGQIGKGAKKAAKGAAKHGAKVGKASARMSKAIDEDFSSGKPKGKRASVAGINAKNRKRTERRAGRTSAMLDLPDPEDFL